MVDSTTNSSVVNFSGLVNQNTITPGYGPEDRIDPYWSMVWSDSDGGPEVIWRSTRSEHRVAEAGIHVPIRRGNIYSPAEAIEKLPRRRPRLVALGAINLWHTITGQQLAAITGRSGLSSAKCRDTGLLFDAGLIQRGSIYYGGHAVGNVPELFRPSSDANKADLRGLRYKDWLGATLGGAQVRGHQYDRHNILMTELSLRAAEMCPLRSVLGEAVASWTQVFGPDLKPNPYRSADAVWVRDDGLKIALEMTASVTASTIAKIDQIAELLARDSMKSTIVLFVVAANSKGGRSSDILNSLRQAVKKSAHSSMTRVLADVENRMVIAKWEDWFPGPGLVAREFVHLGAQRYDARDNEWAPIDLLNPFDALFPGAGHPEVRASLKHLNDVYGTPWWLRQEDGEDFDQYLLEMAGFPV